MFQRIIVPLDGSHTAARALPYAARFARAFDSVITLLSVVPLPATPLGTPHAMLADAAERGRTMADAYLEQVAAPLRSVGITVTTVTRTGNAAEAILHSAEEAAETLIALTTHGRSGVERMQMGSVAQHIVRHASVPVLVVGSQGMSQADGDPLFTGVTVTLDGSSLAEAALPPAVAIATAMSLPLTLYRVIPDYTWPGMSLAVGVAYYPTEDVIREEDDVARYLKEIAVNLRTPQLAVATVSDRGLTNRADGAIRDRLSAQPHDLLVMASHGRGGILRWALGSTTEELVAHPPCPMLVIRPHASAPHDIGHVLAVEASGRAS